MIVALFVEGPPRGVYCGIDGVDAWHAPERDARIYPGPWPVVAHPPCARWSRLAGLVEARYGHRRGDDGKCFAAALQAVRMFGGVLEHPADSAAWRAFGLLRPPRSGGWVRADGLGWTCHVEQAHYGQSHISARRRAERGLIAAPSAPSPEAGRETARALPTALDAATPPPSFLAGD